MGNLISSNIDTNFYQTVNQRSHSSSLTTSSASSSSSSNPMLGDIDEEKEKMTQIEMYQTFIGQSPRIHHNDSTHLIPNHYEHSSKRKKRKKKKLKRYRNKKRNEESWFDDITSCFKKTDSHRLSMDRGNRSIEYTNHNGGRVVIEHKPNRFTRNTINNQKYSLFTFFPLFLFEQFNQFWNLYFLCVAITQLPIPGSIFQDFWIGYWWTTVLPLVFVVSISMLREAFDDLQRKKRDYLINSETYSKLNLRTGSGAINNIESVASCAIRIGDLILLNEGDRVPCDMILLYCENENGTTFIKTDQLDGETDWKLRKSVPWIQKQYKTATDLVQLRGKLTVEAPLQNIYKFQGKFEVQQHDEISIDDEVNEALNLENTLWGSTRIASEGRMVGCSVYLGKESRQQLNANDKRFKIGVIDAELNKFAKVLVAMLVLIAAILTMSRGIHWNSYLYFGRFLLILSDIIPLSLRVYMDLSKIWFSFMIERDRLIPNTTVRDTTIPEELGRIQYLFSDKTGTLTRNEMIFQKLQLKPPLLFQAHNYRLVHDHFVSEVIHSIASNKHQQNKKVKRKKKKKKKKVNKSHSLIGIDELQLKLQKELSTSSCASSLNRTLTSHVSSTKMTKSISKQVTECITALAICHNVTPIINCNEYEDQNTVITYEASSPDEIAMVKFTEKCGINLMDRSTEQITLRVYEEIAYDDSDYIDLKYDILNVFPFTSESKRMGIIIRSPSDEIIFYSKGADAVMKNMIAGSNQLQNYELNEEWMEEEVENLSREGLRTLVFASRTLSSAQYDEFLAKYTAASISMSASRKIQMESVRHSLLEQNMELLGITGVEDKLQDNVQSTIEILRNARIKIWMLTGDKVETAKVIARSSRLISYGQEIYELIIKNKRDAYHKLDVLYGKNSMNAHNLAIVMDGKSLEIFMNTDDNLRHQFLEYIIECQVVISCRCSPTQKAEMVDAVQKWTQKVCCAIGDGGNDVSMILAADVGVGICGKEGQQASLSSDFSISKFEYLSILLLWHGRIAYKNTSLIAQFVIHRGLIIAFITTLFSVIFYFAAVPLFTGALMVGYTCVFTSLPVFSLVMDRDISFENSLFYPELYHSLQSGLSLNSKSFLLWIMRSFFQGSCIMLFTLILFENEVHNIVSITFTALILTELYNVYLEIHKIHFLMILSELVSISLYIVCIFIFSNTYFDKQFVFSATFVFKSLLISGIANIPVFIIKFIHKKCNPSMQAKLKDDPQ